MVIQNHTSHSFSTQLAAQFNSVEAAIIIQHFFFWCKNNRESNKIFYFRDNNWWTSSTRKGLAKYFDYLTENKIRGAIELLKKKGLIITGNYNPNPHDKTNWYALTEAGWNLFGGSIDEINPSSGGNHQSSGEINNSTGDNNKSSGENNQHIDITLDDKLNNKIDIELPVEVDRNLWEDFLKMRKKIKAEPTEEAKPLLIDDLKSFIAKGLDPNESLKKSIKNNWKDLFETDVKIQVSAKNAPDEKENPKIVDLRAKLKEKLPKYRNIWFNAKIEEKDGSFIVFCKEKDKGEILRDYWQKLEDLKVELRIKDFS